ncbi:MAG: DUF4838 domain-containing protein [Bacilli bacterium]|nr:DUF4838 domain-containing protein [Bacilli bacterium]
MKMKKLSILAGALATLMLVGCSNGNGGGQVTSYVSPGTYINEDGVVTTGYEDVHVDPSTTVFKGVHDFTYDKTTHPLVKKGKSKYKVVIPENSSNVVMTARDELIYFFEKATGVVLESTYDSNVSYTNECEYICLGENWFNKKAHVSVDPLELGADGLIITTRGNSIFLLGGSDYGTLNAVYDLLHLYFKLEVYSPDVYEIDKNVRNLALWDFAVKDIPDIGHRAQNYGFVRNGNGNYDQSHVGYRLRVSKDRGHFFMPVFREFAPTGNTVKSTNTNTYIPYDMFASTHPKWFSDNCETGKYQLCYTAHGDPDEYKALVEKVALKITISLKHFTPDLYPDMNVITFTMEDNFNLCECEACKAAEAKYGAQSGALVTFVNQVGDIIDAWMKDEANAPYKRDGFKIIYFAYNGFVDAPVNKTAEGGYAPTCEEVKLRDNTGVYLAIIDRCDFQYDFFNNPIHNGGKDQDMSAKETLLSWGALTDSIWLWLYETNFAYFTYFYDSFSYFTQPFYDYIANQGVRMYFSQGQDTMASGCTGTNWNNLKAYLNAKMSWDSSLDQSVLMDRYFNAMYGRASDQMRALFNLCRDVYRSNLEEFPELTVSRSIYNRLNRRDLNKLSALESMVSLGNEAQEIIMNSNDYDEATKDNLLKNVEAEVFCPFLHILELYDMSISIPERREITSRLLNDIPWLRLDSMMTRESGGTSVLDFVQGYVI